MGVNKYKNILTKNFLKKEYLTNKKSAQEIGITFKIPRITIVRYLKKFKIELRNASEQNSMNRLKETHDITKCNCCICKTKRGEYKETNHPSYVEGKRHRLDSYIEIKVYNYSSTKKDGYMFEHRYVMEQYLGRYLTLKEVVHHINGIKNDNRIENLMLFSSESKHQKYHHKKRDKNEISKIV